MLEVESQVFPCASRKLKGNRRIGYLFIYLFIYLFMDALGLCYCVRAFSSCDRWGLLFIAMCGLLIAVAMLLLWSTDSRHVGFSSCGTQAQSLWHAGSRGQAQQL